MDIKQLKFLCALDETRHFSQAAARCHVAADLSMRLRSLEEELGLELVRRSQRFELHRGRRARTGLGAACWRPRKGCTRKPPPRATGRDRLRWAWSRWPASTRCFRSSMAGRHPELRFQLYS